MRTGGVSIWYMQGCERMFGENITIFNYDENTDSYYPTVMEGVEVQNTLTVEQTQTGAKETNKVTIHIPYREDYLKPNAWKKAEDKENFFTFNAKNRKDCVYCGAWESKESVEDEKYTNGFYEYLCKNYDDVYLISTVSEYKTIPHWEVGGK